MDIRGKLESQFACLWGEEKIKIGSLFSGIGGLDLGIERGLSKYDAKTVWQIEMDEHCCDILEKRFPTSQVINKSIYDVDFTKLEPVDMLVGGFPPAKALVMQVTGKE